MRTDLLSKRLYIAGCFALPWLWVVHWLYWRGHRNGDENENNDSNNETGILNPDDHFQEEPTEASMEEIQQEAAKWVERCKRSAIVAILVWIGWIVAAQLLPLPVNWYIMNKDDAALTGW